MREDLVQRRARVSAILQVVLRSRPPVSLRDARMDAISGTTELIGKSRFISRQRRSHVSANDSELHGRLPRGKIPEVTNWCAHAGIWSNSRDARRRSIPHAIIFTPRPISRFANPAQFRLTSEVGDEDAVAFARTSHSPTPLFLTLPACLSPSSPSSARSSSASSFPLLPPRSSTENSRALPTLRIGERRRQSPCPHRSSVTARRALADP